MTRVRELLIEATSILQEAGIEIPRLDADVLLAAVLNMSRGALLARLDDEIEPDRVQAFRAAVERRLAREPVAYITGVRVWRDLELTVTPDVLIPRPETEQLVDSAVAWARKRPAGRIADVGTGSGAIAIAMARALPAWDVIGTDVSEAALGVAMQNAARLAQASNLSFVRGNLLESFAGPLDAIVANLPYIGREELATVAEDVVRYEPELALVGGETGAELMCALLGEARSKLAAGGAIFLELGPPQMDAVVARARQEFPGHRVISSSDLAGLPRYVTVVPE